MYNEPTNDSFCVVAAAGLLTSGETGGSLMTTRIARSAIDGGSGAGGETGTGTDGTGTGSGRGVNGSARGCSNEVSHEIRITHTSAPKAEPDTNDNSRRRSFETCADEAVCTTLVFARPGSARRATGGRLTRVLGVGRGVAGPIGAARSEENWSSGSAAHRPLRSWLTLRRDESIGFSGTVTARQSAIPIPVLFGQQSPFSCNAAERSGQKSPRMSFFLLLGRYLR